MIQDKRAEKEDDAMKIKLIQRIKYNRTTLQKNRSYDKKIREASLSTQEVKMFKLREIWTTGQGREGSHRNMIEERCWYPEDTKR